MTSIDLHGLAQILSLTMQCNCDLDNWQPERTTGHSWVCDIHKRCLDIRNGYSKPPCPECGGLGFVVVNRNYSNPEGEQEQCQCQGEGQ